jgi:hypothetical protein
MNKQASAFFFEKKNQKTFTHSGPASPHTRPKTGKSFFASFFSKKEDSSLC